MDLDHKELVRALALLDSIQVRKVRNVSKNFHANITKELQHFRPINQIPSIMSIMRAHA